MALAVRTKDVQLLREINRALGQLAESGELHGSTVRWECRFIPRFRHRSRRSVT